MVLACVMVLVCIKMLHCVMFPLPGSHSLSLAVKGKRRVGALDFKYEYNLLQQLHRLQSAKNKELYCTTRYPFPAYVTASTVIGEIYILAWLQCTYTSLVDFYSWGIDYITAVFCTALYDLHCREKFADTSKQYKEVFPGSAWAAKKHSQVLPSTENKYSKVP